MGDLQLPASVSTQLTRQFSSLANSLSSGIVDKILLRANPNSPQARAKVKNNLQREWITAQENLTNAPLELSLAEKNYYVYNNGEPGGDEVYNLTIIDRFANTANELKMNSIDKQQEFMADLTQSLKQYQGQKLFADRTMQLLNVRKQENADLVNKLEMFNRILQTSERKVVYEDKDSTSQKTYRRVMLFLYYSAIVCYIIFSNFIPEKLYLNKTIWIMIIIASLVPLILNLIIKWVFIISDVVAYWFHERPYKDAYGDLNIDAYGTSKPPPVSLFSVTPPEPRNMAIDPVTTGTTAAATTTTAAATATATTAAAATT